MMLSVGNILRQVVWNQNMQK